MFATYIKNGNMTSILMAHLSYFKFWSVKLTGYRPGYLQVVQQGHPGIFCPMFFKIIVGVIDSFQRFPGWWRSGKHFIPFRCEKRIIQQLMTCKEERNVFLVFIIKVFFLEKTVDLNCYCWWTKSCTTKDDGYPIIHRALTCFNHPRWCRISSINSINRLFRSNISDLSWKIATSHPNRWFYLAPAVWWLVWFTTLNESLISWFRVISKKRQGCDLVRLISR